jgi:putative ABC transport system permease protein
MIVAIPLAWLQLSREKLRLLVAVSGVGFAVVLIFMQLGFREALFDSAVRYHTNLEYDLALISPATDFIVQPENFSRRRLFQVRGFPGVDSVSPVYLGQALWKNPNQSSQSRTIFVVGFDPSDEVFSLPGIVGNVAQLQKPKSVLYDGASRSEFGPVVDLFRSSDVVETEVNNRAIEVVGLFELGTSFGIDASIVTSDLNFLRLFPNRDRGLINLGLVKLTPGANPEAVRDAVAGELPNDVEVLTRDDFITREIDYWNSNTPIGYVFTFGVIIGLMVGSIIVYQILFADVSDHLQEYATLKAMGYGNAFLFGVVFQEAVILAVLGFLPGLLVCLGLYRLAGDATRLPLEMTLERGAFVMILTIAMCCVSGAIALRKIRSADPADVF